MVVDRFEPHTHTEYSNSSTGLDSINKLGDLIDYAIDQGLKGLAITDHESLSGHVQALKHMKEINKQNPDLNFKLVLGNEIYLVDERKNNQRYYHCIIHANGERGYRALKEMSSHARMLSYMDRRKERTPTTKKELEDILKKYPNAFIITSACLGGELAACVTQARSAHERKDELAVKEWSAKMHSFITFMKRIAGDNFYIEIAPSRSEEQMYFNNMAVQIGKHYNVKLVLGTDAHYLRKEDLYIQEALLRSRQEEREVVSFYEYAYLQNQEEIIENLKGIDISFEELCANSIEMMNKVDTNYNLFKKQKIPKENVKHYDKLCYTKWKDRVGDRMFIKKAFLSEDNQERYYINQVLENLDKKDKLTDDRLDRINEECDILYVIGEQLDDCMFAYSNTLQSYIDLIWDCGSIVGPGRGCFLPDMEVSMSNGCTKKIVDVNKGDIVINDDGRVNKVIDKYIYNIKEEMTEINVCGKKIKCTNDHKILCYRTGLCENPIYNKKQTYCKNAGCRVKKCEHRSSPKLEWVEASKIKKSDMLVYPKPIMKEKKVYSINMKNYGDCKNIKSEIIIDKDFSEFIGLYLGNGWIIDKEDTKSFKLGIAFNSQTGLLKAERYKELVRNIFGENIEVHCYKHLTRKVYQLYIYNKEMVKMIKNLCGHGAINKKIPEILLNNDKDCLKSLIIGLMDTDGCYKDEGKITYSSINYSLCTQIKMVFAYLGYFSNITERIHKKKSWKNEYKVCLSGKQLLSLKNDFLPKIRYTEKKGQWNTFRQDENNFYFRHSGISHFFYEGKVYDLHVENNHSYMINQAAVHNSACSWTGNYGLGITQIDPMDYGLFHWRFLNKERPELPRRNVKVGQL